jgi:hypothetical protein
LCLKALEYHRTVIVLRQEQGRLSALADLGYGLSLGVLFSAKLIHPSFFSTSFSGIDKHPVPW